MRKLVNIFLFAVIFTACSPKIIYLPGENTTTVVYKDSLIYKTDTLKIDLPLESVKEYVSTLDTLRMETSIAEAYAFIDTSVLVLKGGLKNKDTSLSKPQIVYKEKISYRDSIKYVKEPYPVEVVKEKKYVPKVYKYSLGFTILSILILILWILRKLKIIKI